MSKQKRTTNGFDLLSQQEEHEAPTTEGFSHFIAVCFTVNYIIGTGFLTIPWAFQQGGLVLSALTLVGVVFISNITKNYLLQGMAIAQAIMFQQEQCDNEVGGVAVESVHSSGSSGYGSIAGVELVQNEEQVTAPLQEKPPDPENNTTLLDDLPHEKQAAPKDEPLVVGSRKFEVLDLCRIYIGSIGEKVLVWTISLDVYMELWCFTSVFSSSFARQIPMLNYVAYTALFAVVVVPLSCLELKEQVAFQITLSVLRIVVIFIMIMTTLAAAYSSTHHEDPTTHVYFKDTIEIQGAVAFDFGKFYEMFSVMFYSTQFHLSVPVLSHAVKDKRQLGGIFRDALLVCMVAFGILAVVAWFFGDHIHQSANLNWNTFVGGINLLEAQDPHVVPLWATAVSVFILIFPALNVLSAYPLNAILLGNNLMAIAYGDSIEDAKGNSLVRVLFRILAAVPPIIGAIFVRELGVITDYAGMFGAVSAMPFPALICILSRRAAEQRGLSKQTLYDGIGSSNAWAATIFVLSNVSLVYILVNLALQ